ncbi:MAG: hypothetical protein LBP42_01925, partial [Treponema sp.]|nr:hypothetical protein [Treponema sp.]
EIPGRLIISGIVPALYGTYRVYVVNNSDESIYKTNYRAVSDGDYELSGTPVTVQLLSEDGVSPWSGEGEDYYVFLEDSNGLAAKSSGMVSFTNGNGTVSSFSEIITGYLTITGIDPDSYGSYRVYVSNPDDPTNPEALNDTVEIGSSEERIKLSAPEGASWADTGTYDVFLLKDEILVGQTLATFKQGRASVAFSVFSLSP